MVSKKRVIILGHTGFLGTHLERKLTKTTYWEVIGRSLPEMDLTQYESAKKLIPFLTPDSHIIVAAASKRQFGDTIESYQTNMDIILNLCKLLEKHPVRQIIYMSSSAVYGEETENVNITEETNVNPTSFYGISKYSAERLLMKTCKGNENMLLTLLRPPLIYGPSDEGNTYGPSGFFTSASSDLTITLWGNGEELREFIFVEDFCNIMEVLLKETVPGVFNVVSGIPYCFMDAINEIKKHFPEMSINSRSRTQDKVDNAFNPSKIKAILPQDFKFTALEDGILEMRDYAKKP